MSLQAPVNNIKKKNKKIILSNKKYFTLNGDLPKTKKTESINKSIFILIIIFPAIKLIGIKLKSRLKQLFFVKLKLEIKYIF